MPNTHNRRRFSRCSPHFSFILYRSGHYFSFFFWLNTLHCYSFNQNVLHTFLTIQWILFDDEKLCVKWPPEIPNKANIIIVTRAECLFFFIIVFSCHKLVIYIMICAVYRLVKSIIQPFIYMKNVLRDTHSHFEFGWTLVRKNLFPKINQMLLSAPNSVFRISSVRNINA